MKEVEAITDPAVFSVVRFAMSAIPFITFVLRGQGADSKCWDRAGILGQFRLSYVGYG